jgi:hypothetical protein
VEPRAPEPSSTAAVRASSASIRRRNADAIPHFAPPSTRVKHIAPIDFDRATARRDGILL